MKQIRIGIIGFGKVIRAFLEMLPDKSEQVKSRYGLDLKVVAICDSTQYMHNYEGFDPEELLAMKLEKNATVSSLRPASEDEDRQFTIASFLQNEVNAVIEALPPNRDSGQPALAYLLAFLQNRVPVVTVNKSPLVFGFQQLLAMSRKTGAPIKFSGATAAALPTSDLFSISLAGQDIYGFEGILNGTTNFLLTEMINNQSSLDEELELAKELKICEPDPSFDIDGWDTAFKTLILAKAFIDPFAELPDIEIQGIRGITYADLEPVLQAGNTVKLLGKVGFENNKLRLRVTPSIITPDHPFFRVDGTQKSITVFSDAMGKLTLIGGATGLKEIAATILKDIINLNRNLNFN
mgnify:CR=1 FL=1